MFFLFPVGVDYRARRYPVVTFAIMGICIAVYLVTLGFRLSGDAEDVDDWVYENLWLIPALGHWWTYFTCQFVHAGIFHLLGNMIYLFLFGSCVEDLIGRVRYTIFYLASGVLSALAYVLVSAGHFDSEIPMGGASGAISSCIGAFLFLLAKSRIEFKWVIFLFLRLWNGNFFLPAWVVISFWFAKDLLMMLAAMGEEHQGGGVAFGAHVGGTLVGLGWGAFERMRLKRNGELDELEEAMPAPALVIHRPVSQPVRVAVRRAAAAVPAETPTIHLYWNDTQSGPFTNTQVQQMFVAGEIPTEALYAMEGMTEWRPAEELRAPGTI